MDLVRRSVALAVVAALSVGCTGEEPEPKLAPSTESAASTPSGSVGGSPDASSTETATPLSPRAEQRRFLDEYFAAITRAISNGDVRPFLDLSSQECHNCQVIARNISKAYSGGGRVLGGGWSVSRADFFDREPLGDVWNVTIKTKQERWFDGRGDLVKTVSAEAIDMAIAVRQAAGELRVRELRLR